MIVPILNSREVRHTAAERPRVAGTSTSKSHIIFSIQDNFPEIFFVLSFSIKNWFSTQIQNFTTQLLRLKVINHDFADFLFKDLGYVPPL